MQLFIEMLSDKINELQTMQAALRRFKPRSVSEDATQAMLREAIMMLAAVPEGAMYGAWSEYREAFIARALAVLETQPDTAEGGDDDGR